jgi:hypothetical protein
MRTIDQMIQSEVLVCLSSLVSTLAAGNSGHIADHDLINLAEQASDLAAPVCDYEEAATQEGWTQCPDGRWWRPGESEDDPGLFEQFLGSGPFIFRDNAQEACDLDSIDPYDREVFEHWAVTSWFAEKLAAAGEKVDTDFAGMCVWARTTTGQGIASDGVIERIYADLCK